MTTHDRVRLQLQALEALLREHQHWRNDEPQPHQFNSTQPFSTHNSYLLYDSVCRGYARAVWRYQTDIAANLE